MVQKERTDHDIVVRGQDVLEDVESEELDALQAAFGGEFSGRREGDIAPIAAVDLEPETGSTRALGQSACHIAAAASDVQESQRLVARGGGQSTDGVPEDRIAAADGVDASQAGERLPMRPFVEIGVIHQFGQQAPRTQHLGVLPGTMLDRGMTRVAGLRSGFHLGRSSLLSDSMLSFDALD
jgi:hypothetical protein